jgi:hypothetical protein
LYGANPPSEFQAEALVKELVEGVIEEYTGTLSNAEWQRIKREQQLAKEREPDDLAASAAADYRAQASREAAAYYARQKLQPKKPTPQSAIAARRAKEDAEEAKAQAAWAWKKAHPVRSFFGAQPPSATQTEESPARTRLEDKEQL